MKEILLQLSKIRECFRRIVALNSNSIGSQDTQYNDTEHKGIQHNDTQHNDIQHNDTQHKEIQHNDTQHEDIQHNNK